MADDGPLPQRRQDDAVTKETKSPSTIDAEVLRTAGQRKINAIWEYTQAFIAGMTVTTVLLVAAKLAAFSMDSATGQQVAAFVFLTGVANLVIGFYFGRTNHQRVGGVGGDSAMGGR